MPPFSPGKGKGFSLRASPSAIPKRSEGWGRAVSSFLRPWPNSTGRFARIVGRIGVVATPCQALALAKMRAQTADRLPKAVSKNSGLSSGSSAAGPFPGGSLPPLLEEKMDLAAVTGMDIPPSRYHTLEVYTQDGTVRVSLDEVDSLRPGILPLLRRHDRRIQRSLGGFGPTPGGVGDGPRLEPGHCPDGARPGSPGAGPSQGGSRIQGGPGRAIWRNSRPPR